MLFDKYTKGVVVMTKFRAFLDRKDIHPSLHTYFIDAMGSMALGLFASLLIGTIFSTLYKYIGVAILKDLADCATAVTGAVLGIAIANALHAPTLVMLCAAAVGYAGNGFGGTFVLGGVEKTVTAGPAGALIAVIVAVELGKMVSKETKIDILVTPIVTILSGVLVAQLTCPLIAWCMYWIGWFINTATVMQPIIMGILVSAAVGVALTLPISSAAICAMIGITGLAGGAATAGCCAQMIGFAVISFRENRFGGVIAQGLGTSMLQMGNIVKNPRIWIPATLASMITGPLSTTVFKLECTGVSAGMGTCGLVGPLGILTAMPDGGTMMWIGIAVICFILPALLSLLFSEILRKIGWIKRGDMKLDI